MKKDAGWELLAPGQRTVEGRFDNATLDAAQIKEIDKKWGDGLPWNPRRVGMEVRELGEKWDDTCYEIGRKMLWAKARLEHGAFEKWLDEECGIARNTALPFMRVAENNSDVDKRIRRALGKTKTQYFYLLPDKILEHARDQYAKTGKIGDYTLDQLMEMTTRGARDAFQKVRDRNRDLEKQHERDKEKMRENERRYLTKDDGQESPFTAICKKLDILEQETLELLRTTEDPEERKKDTIYLGVRLTSWGNMVAQVGFDGQGRVIGFPFPKQGDAPEEADDPIDDLL